jgi:hypothetical protein
MTFTQGNNLIATFEGRGNYTLTSAGKSFTYGITLNAPNGTLTMQDDLNVSYSFAVTDGAFITAYNVTSNTQLYLVGLLGTRDVTVTMGNQTWLFANSGTIWAGSANVHSIINANGSTIKATSTSAITFAGAGKTFNNLWYAPAAGTGGLTVTGTNTFTGYIKDDGTADHAITFPNVTTTMASFQRGAGTNVISLIRTGASGQFTLLKTGGGVVSLHHMTVSNSVVAANTWYAGATPPSTDGGGNTSWIFTAAPAGTSKGGMLLLRGGRHGGPGPGSQKR